jgi:hypothetical protein
MFKDSLKDMCTSGNISTVQDRNIAEVVIENPSSRVREDSTEWERTNEEYQGWGRKARNKVWFTALVLNTGEHKTSFCNYFNTVMKSFPPPALTHQGRSKPLLLWLESCPLSQVARVHQPQR